MSPNGGAAARRPSRCAGRRVGEAGRTRHRADRPVCRIGWRRAQCALDYGGDLIVVDRSWPAGSGLVQQAFDTILQEAPPPSPDRVFVHAQLGSNHLALNAVGAAQDDAASLRHRACYPPPADLPLQILPLPGSQNQRRRRSTTRICYAALLIREHSIQCNLLQFQMTRFRQPVGRSPGR